MRRALALPLALALACAEPHPTPAKVKPAAPAAAAAVAPDAEALARDAAAARAAGDPGRARTELEQAIVLAPSWDLPRIHLAELLVAEGTDVDRAWTVLSAVPATSQNPRYHVVLGQLLELRSDDAGAAAAYAAALALRPDADVRMRRALVLERLGRWPEAVAELERVRAERPDDASVRLALAGAYEGAGRRADAEPLLRALADGDPGRAAGWDRLARFYARGGEADKERAAEERARQATAPARALRPLLPSAR